jgi:hypothetical protein
MSIGDLVRVRSHEKYHSGKMGIIIDALDLPDGFTMYEVLIEKNVGWFDDIDLELLGE